MVRPNELTIYLPDGGIAPPVNPYGRLVANAGVYRALARYGGYRRLHFQCRRPAPNRLCEELLWGGVEPPDAAPTGAPEVTSGSPLSTASAVRSGVLLSGQPYLTEPAWIRRHAGADDAYSIVGTVFAFSFPAPRELSLHSLLAPLHESDALVCSSPTLRDTVDRTVTTWEGYLGERLCPGPGSLRLPRPQLPVIPFGVDAESLAAQAGDASARKAMRETHGVAEDDVVVYFLGRLSYYDKAFPQAMLKAVEAAQERTGVRTHFLLTGWFPDTDDRARFEAAAQRYAPGVHVAFLDGNDAATVARCWAAADVFLLLSDTIIETFGQALTEAMAAGLPLVVSDWDGYRSIVRDGVDGFLVPTLGAQPGALGENLALLESLGIVGYPQWAGTVSQHTAVHVGRTAEALSRLLASPELRATMGAAGRRRARELFSWPVVAGQYRELFAELAARRMGRPAPPAPPAHRMPPLRNDPLADFRGLPTAVLDDDLVVQLAPDAVGPDPALELDQLFPTLRATPEETARLISLLEAGAAPVGGLAAAFPPGRRPFLRMTLMWLAKAGVVDWLPES